MRFQNMADRYSSRGTNPDKGMEQKNTEIESNKEAPTKLQQRSKSPVQMLSAVVARSLGRGFGLNLNGGQIAALGHVQYTDQLYDTLVRHTNGVRNLVTNFGHLVQVCRRGLASDNMGRYYQILTTVNARLGLGYADIDHNRPTQWYLAMLQQMNAQPGLVAYLNGNGGRFQTMANHLFAFDNAAAPNLALPVTLVARVLAQNPGQLDDLIRRMDLVLAAEPHMGSTGLPFGNRAGGLRGHFIKHVLGVGNTDVIEPTLWMANLNLLGRIIYRDFYGAIDQATRFELFGANNPNINDPIRDDAASLRNAARAGRVPTDVLAQLFENEYHNRVNNAYDNATGKYFYLDGNAIKINAYHTGSGIFSVSAYHGGFDLSSGYIPYQSGGAKSKWDNQHGQRLWDVP